MKSKLILILAVITLCVFCSVSAALADYSGTITIGVAGNAMELTESLIAEFQSANPVYSGVQFVVEELSEGDAVGEILDNGMQVDIYVFAQDQLSVFVSAGALKPLSEAYAMEAASANVEGAVAAARVGDTMYAFPMTADNGYFLYYDRTVISNPGTLESILADCEANNRLFCMELSSGWYQTAFFFGAGASLNYTTDQNGRIVSATVDYDSAEGLTALKSMRKVAASTAFANISYYEDLDHPEEIGAIVSGTWDYQGLKAIFGDNLGCAKLPMVDGYQLSGFGGYKLAGVTPQADSEKEAICEALAAYLTNEASQLARFEALGWGPSNTAAAASEEVQEDEALAALNAQLQYCVPQGQYPNDYWTVAEEMLSSVISGDCDDMDDDALQAFLADYQTRFENMVPLKSTWTCGDGVTCTLSDEGVLTISGSGEITSRPWTASDVRQIVINEGVTGISKNTFYNCSNLTSVTIADSVTSIGEWAFSYCSSLTSITIPENVTSIGSYVFSYCSDLTSVTIQGSMTNISEYAFYNCSNLTSVTIPDSVTSIGASAFYNCSSLTSVTIPDSVISIGDFAFYCNGLTSVTIPDSVTSIGISPFIGCISLTNISVSQNNPIYASIDGALYNKDKTELIQWPGGKTNVIIPEGVTRIGEYAFSGCSGLTSITIPEGVTSIGEYAFNGCGGLTNLTIPENLTNIASSAFINCTSLTSISVSQNNNVYSSMDGVLFNKAQTEIILWPRGKTNVAIPEGVTSIGSYAFYYCSSLTSITIPDTVASIGDYAFFYCSNLTNVTIPDGVTSIGNYTFCHCSSLTSITIPDNVTSIGDCAFMECSSLTSITIPEEVTNIGQAAFSNCSSLTSITIPEGVTGIASQTFYSCTSLTSITIPDSVTSIGNIAFGFCSSLTNVIIPEGVTSVEDNAFMYCSALTKISLPKSIHSIGKWAFDRCNNLSEVHYSGTLAQWAEVEIEDGNDYLLNAFIQCSDGNMNEPENGGSCGDGVTWTLSDEGVLTISGTGEITSRPWSASDVRQIVINEGVTGIGGFAFYGCSNLTSVTIPESVVSIDAYAFAACSNLTSITIPTSVTSISDSVFGQCSSLTSIAIPVGVTSIGSTAFYECTGLVSITIPDSVTSIGLGAFQACTNLSDVYYAGTEDEWGSISIEDENDQLSNATIHYNYVPEASIVSSGTCGESLSWTLDSDGLLTITGEGAMSDFRLNTLPWKDSVGSITAVNIEDGVTSIGDCAFATCSSLMSIMIPNSLTRIGYFAFHNCSSLTSVTIPDSVVSIDAYAFAACSNLTSITIPTSVTSISDSVFGQCSSLTSVTIPDGVTSIGSTAFYECTGLVSITIPDSVTSIGVGAFGECESLTTITIPASVTSLGNEVFEGCASLTEIVFLGTENEWQTLIANTNNSKLADCTITCTGGSSVSDEQIILPRSLTTIETEAFLGVAASEIDIPDGVTFIGANAFPSDATLIVGSGTYAESWARDNGYTPVIR